VELPTTLEDTKRLVEKTMLKRALEAYQGNQSRAAMSLGMKRTTFVEAIKRHDLDNDFGDRVILVRVLGPRPKKMVLTIED
jgi:DNA-binding NtrC family response regulator